MEAAAAAVGAVRTPGSISVAIRTVATPGAVSPHNRCLVRCRWRHMIVVKGNCHGNRNLGLGVQTPSPETNAGVWEHGWKKLVDCSQATGMNSNSREYYMRIANIEVLVVAFCVIRVF